MAEVQPEIVGVATSAQGSNATSLTLKLPNGSNVAGRRLVAIAAKDGNGAITWPAGWRVPRGSGADGVCGDNLNYMSVRYRDLDGEEGYPAEGATISVTGASEEWEGYVVLIEAGTFDPSDPPEMAAATGGEGNADPPNLEPTWGVSPVMWLAACVVDSAASQSGPSAYPTNYTTNQYSHVSSANTGSVIFGAALRILPEDNADNPGTFTNRNDGWRAITLGVRGGEPRGPNVPKIDGDRQVNTYFSSDFMSLTAMEDRNPGDLLLVESWIETSEKTPTTPEGWKFLGSTEYGGALVEVFVYARIADGTEDDDFSHSWTGAIGRFGEMRRITGATLDLDEIVVGAAHKGANETPTWKSATSPAAESLGIGIYNSHEEANFTNWPADWVPDWATWCPVITKELDASEATGEIAGTFSGGENWVTLMVIIPPLAAALGGVTAEALENLPVRDSLQRDEETDPAEDPNWTPYEGAPLGVFTPTGWVPASSEGPSDMSYEIALPSTTPTAIDNVVAAGITMVEQLEEGDELDIYLFAAGGNAAASVPLVCFETGTLVVFMNGEGGNIDAESFPMPAAGSRFVATFDYGKADGFQLWVKEPFGEWERLMAVSSEGWSEAPNGEIVALVTESAKWVDFRLGMLSPDVRGTEMTGYELEGTAAVFDVPAGAVRHDALIATFVADSVSAVTPPSDDWQLVFSGPGPWATATVFWYVLPDWDGVTTEYSFAFGGEHEWQGAMQAICGHDPLRPLDAVGPLDYSHEAEEDPVPILGVPTTVDGCLLLSYGYNDHGYFGDPQPEPEWDELGDQLSGPNLGMKNELVVAGPQEDIENNLNNIAQWASLMLAVRPPQSRPRLIFREDFEVWELNGSPVYDESWGGGGVSKAEGAFHGDYCAKCGTEAKNVLEAPIATALDETYYFRAGFKFAALPSENSNVFGFWATDHSPADVFWDAGAEQLTIWNNVTEAVEAYTDFAPTPGDWFYIEVKYAIATSGDSLIALVIRDEAGNPVYSSGDLAVSVGNKALTIVGVGNNSSDEDIYVDDFAAADNVWVGPYENPNFDPFEQAALGDAPTLMLRGEDRGNGQAVDWSGFNNHGSYGGLPALGQLGYGGAGEGAKINPGDYIVVPDDSTLDTADTMTLEWVVRFDTLPAEEDDVNHIGSKGTGSWALRLLNEGGGDISLNVIKENTAIVTYAEPEGGWVAGVYYHIVLAKTGSVHRLEVNAVDAVKGFSNQTLTDTSQALYIGRSSSNSSEEGDNTIDFFALYPTLLSEAQVGEHYEALTGEEAGPTVDLSPTSLQTASTVNVTAKTGLALSTAALQTASTVNVTAKTGLALSAAALQGGTTLTLAVPQTLALGSTALQTGLEPLGIKSGYVIALDPTGVLTTAAEITPSVAIALPLATTALTTGSSAALHATTALALSTTGLVVAPSVALSVPQNLVLATAELETSAKALVVQTPLALSRPGLVTKPSLVLDYKIHLSGLKTGLQTATTLLLSKKSAPGIYERIGGQWIRMAAHPSSAPVAAGSFSAYHSAVFLTPGVSPYILPWNKELWDVSGWFDTTTGRFTPQAAGIYRLTVATYVTEVESTQIFILKNGGGAIQVGQTSGENPHQVGSILVAANGTDYFQVQLAFSPSPGFVVTDSSLCYFQGEMVGRMT